MERKLREDVLQIVQPFPCHYSLLCRRAVQTASLHNRLICRHNIDYFYTDVHRKTVSVVLAKYRTAPWWWFRREPKHVGVSVIILNCFNISMIFIIVCVSWNNKKCFDTIDVRCKHEDSFLCVSGVTQYIVLTLFARLFVQYYSSLVMSLIRFIISP